MSIGNIQQHFEKCKVLEKQISEIKAKMAEHKNKREKLQEEWRELTAKRLNSDDEDERKRYSNAQKYIRRKVDKEDIIIFQLRERLIQLENDYQLSRCRNLTIPFRESF